MGSLQISAHSSVLKTDMSERERSQFSESVTELDHSVQTVNELFTPVLPQIK